MSTLTVSVANCVIGGERTTNYDNGWLRNLIQLQLGNHEVEIVQQPTAFRADSSSLKDHFNFTTQLFIHGVRELRAARVVADDISALLSLATMSQVRPFAYEYNGDRSTHTTTGITVIYRPTIEVQDGRQVRHYLESTWISYRKLKRRRKLAAVIDYLVTADLPLQPLEVRLLLVFVAMENLKATYAREKKIPYSTRGFHKVTIPMTRSIKRYRTYTFEELLRLMLHEVGILRGLKQTSRLRNQIVHWGLSKRPYASLDRTYDFCQDLTREYLLRLLQYEGPFLLYSSASRLVKHLRRRRA